MDSQTQKLLGAVVKNTQMCQTTLNKLIGITKDAELKKKIHEQLATHEDISNRARAMLAADGCEVKPESAMAKMSAQMGIAMKTMRDASSRNLAQMMIEGNHMGVTDLTMAIKEATAPAACGKCLCRPACPVLVTPFVKKPRPL